MTDKRKELVERAIKALCCEADATQQVNEGKDYEVRRTPEALRVIADELSALLAADEGAVTKNITCPYCEAAVREAVEHTDSAGVSSWTLSSRCSNCLEAAHEVMPPPTAEAEEMRESLVGFARLLSEVRASPSGVAVLEASSFDDKIPLGAPRLFVSEREPAAPAPAPIGGVGASLLQAAWEAYDHVFKVRPDHYAGREDDAMRAALSVVLRTPTPEAEEAAKACEWSEDTDGFWRTGCGKTWFFDSGQPDENGMKFCHACGKRLAARALRGER